MRTNLPRAVRSLRIRRHWRQADLADRALLGRDLVSRLESGRLDGITVRSLDRLAQTLDATLVVEVRWRGADLDRLIDRAHAHLANAAMRRLTAAGWVAQAEVSYNHYGDRGSCDVLALDPRSGTVLVIEVKSRLGNIQDTLRQLDVKARLAQTLSRQVGWPAPSSVARALVLPDDRSSRRALHTHPALFAAFGVRGREALAWLRRPRRGVAGALWFEKPAAADGNGVMRVRTQRRPHNV